MGKRALITPLWAVALLTIWSHFLTGPLGKALGQPLPGTSDPAPSAAALLAQAALLTLPIPAFVWFARSRFWRVQGLPVILALWIGATWLMLQPFVALLDQPYSPADPFERLFWHPVLTPAALVLLFLVGYHALTRPLRPS